MKKAIIYSLTVVTAAAGLLLGGNVRADAVPSTTAQTTSTQDASVQIAQIREEIAELTAQVNASQKQVTVTNNPVLAQTITTQDASVQIAQIRQKIAELTAQVNASQKQGFVTVVKPVLTQAQLDKIDAEIKRIANETARIQNEVRILLEIRAVEQKISDIKAQIAALGGAKSTVSTMVPSVPQISVPATSNQAATTTAEVEKAVQIAKIKQQISELTQEYETQKNLEAQNQKVATVTEECAGGSCEVTTTPENIQPQSQIVVSPKTTEASKPETKGFWESVGDFFRKVFTF